jgi:hypothetical protein
MLKTLMTLLLAVTIFLGWTAFTGGQAAAGQPLNQRTDAHLRGYGPYLPAGYGYAPGHYPRPYPYRYFAPPWRHHPPPVLYVPYYHAPRPYPIRRHYAPPAPRPYPYHRRY